MACRRQSQRAAVAHSLSPSARERAAQQIPRVLTRFCRVFDTRSSSQTYRSASSTRQLRVEVSEPPVASSRARPHDCTGRRAGDPLVKEELRVQPPRDALTLDEIEIAADEPACVVVV
eukprot:2876985-Pleurochrysis_carterae.AAC.1